MTACFLKIRHPERSEAEDALFQECTRPSVVEGPSHFFAPIAATEMISFARSRSAVFRHRSASRLPRVSSQQTRSFDCGSAGRNGQTHLPLAFAQDDGIFLWVSPVLWLRFAQHDGFRGRRFAL